MGVSLGPADYARSLWRIVRGKPNVPPSLQDNALLGAAPAAPERAQLQRATRSR